MSLLDDLKPRNSLERILDTHILTLSLEMVKAGGSIFRAAVVVEDDGERVRYKFISMVFAGLMRMAFGTPTGEQWNKVFMYAKAISDLEHKKEAKDG